MTGMNNTKKKHRPLFKRSKSTKILTNNNNANNVNKVRYISIHAYTIIIRI